MRLSERWGGAAALAGVLLAGCGVHSLDAGTPGTGGGAGTGVVDIWPPMISDFEDIAGATVVQQGSPPMNGYWYAYDDGSLGCNQIPRVGDPYRGEPPPTLRQGTIGALALHAVWKACETNA
jgi:hypothetical protein